MFFDVTLRMKFCHVTTSHKLYTCSTYLYSLMITCHLHFDNYCQMKYNFQTIHFYHRKCRLFRISVFNIIIIIIYLLDLSFLTTPTLSPGFIVTYLSFQFTSICKNNEVICRCVETDQ